MIECGWFEESCVDPERRESETERRQVAPIVVPVQFTVVDAPPVEAR